MPYAKVGDINLYYEVHGEGDPIVHITGAGNTKNQERLIPVYSPEYQMVIFDNRGAGQSDKPDIPYTMEMMADDVAGLLDVIGINSAHIRGGSMGGMIAQHFALRYPERVKSLILYSTGCGGQMPSMHSAEILNLFNTLLQEKLTVSEMFRKALLLFVTEEFLDNNPNFIKRMADMTENPLPDHVWRHYIQAQFEHDTYDRLPDIKAPTLVIHGEKDKVCTVENAKTMASRVPNSELVVFENTGHMLIEAGGKDDELILDFLRRNSQK